MSVSHNEKRLKQWLNQIIAFGDIAENVSMQEAENRLKMIKLAAETALQYIPSEPQDGVKTRELFKDAIIRNVVDIIQRGSDATMSVDRGLDHTELVIKVYRG